MNRYPFKLVCWLFFAFPACHGSENATEYCVDWSISFKLDHEIDPESNDLNYGVKAKVFGLESFRYKDKYSWSSRYSVEVRTNKGVTFKLSPVDTEFSKSTSLKVGKSYVFMAYHEGRFSEPFKLTVKKNSPLHIKNVLLRFPNAPKNVFKVRIISLNTGRFLEEFEFNLISGGGNPGADQYGAWKIATAYTDDRGILTFHNVPERRLFLQDDRFALEGNRHFSTLGPNGTPQYADRGIRPLSVAKMKELKDKDIPVFYYIHPKMGLIWKTEFMLPLKPEFRQEAEGSPYKEIVREGTELSFVREIQPKFQKLGLIPTSFKVVIGKNGFIKTPMVPAGLYTLTTNSPRYNITKTYKIFGLGSVWSEERQPRGAIVEKKP